MITIQGHAVLRDGEQIGSIRDGFCFSKEKLPPAIKGQIKKAAGDDELAFAIGAVEGGLTPQEPEVVRPAPVSPNHLQTMTAAELVAATAETAPLFGLERLTALVESGKIPAPPPTRPDMGDKDPAYVAWYREHATPEEFEAKYRGRKTPTLEEADAGERARRAKLDAEGTFRL